MLGMLEMVSFLNKKSQYLMSSLIIFLIAGCARKFRDVTSNNQWLGFYRSFLWTMDFLKGIFHVFLEPVGVG